VLEARADTLSLFEIVSHQQPALQVPRLQHLNPPLWELGHVGWFQEYWTTRNPQQALGLRADPLCKRRPGIRGDADALYNSATVVHQRRWDLPLPDARQTLDDLQQQLELCLAQLQQTPDDDTGLYFHRLALFHEDMHHEAGLTMAQALGVAINNPRWQPQRIESLHGPLPFDARDWVLGRDLGLGFSFDNELPACTVPLTDYEIDAQVVRWAEYLPFVEQGGYLQPAFWDDAGQAWLNACGLEHPVYLNRSGAGHSWQQRRDGAWRPLELSEPAVHLSPTEAEWEQAACQAPERFRWGDVWEWTASPHAPFAGFKPHPYQDYAAPFFDGRPVLKGGSFLTQDRMKHPSYRNFFTADRCDIAAGFRSCAVKA
jgi:iron(II)-dependent oxidoreductase